MAEHSTAEKYRYITRTPGVRSGRAIVDGTRIGVHDVVAYHLLGATVEEIAKCFPDLSRAQIYECLAYFEDHKDEITPLALEQIDPGQNGNPTLALN
ncbi:MAG: DUF433 domain-containing protein [Verrucomicrobiia bacterium]